MLKGEKGCLLRGGEEVRMAMLCSNLELLRGLGDGDGRRLLYLLLRG